ncbi:FAD/NAD(P)-binding oxidoreductase [Humibacillus sp. DSM 29435]|uniref:NAD(P)/FAD-dependent oxidoreductase n=1 Tax=Humibacillus sp. DSM 29435 TaxID=1869167 RepID=UPI000872EC37|nr:NAD(P)/FAD-dependent oxidoreductase [Humibacillus sp. DSM 29435]OFE15231.1 FAD/NAD(P)-binding oxidoreductase [Humibacillus sp. DSM 29435]
MTTPDLTPSGADHDVVVIGAGPAGMACVATLLAETSLTVGLVDAGHGAGGQYWRQPAPVPTPHPGEPAPRRAGLHHDLATFHRLRDALDRGAASGRLATRFAHHVWSVTANDPGPVAEGGFAVHVVDRSGRPGDESTSTITGRALVIATGAFDRALPFPGWDLPGVMTVGGLQALLKAGDVAAGRRVAIGGTGPFLLPVAAALAARGSTVVGVFEANHPVRWLRESRAVARNVGKLGEGAGYAATLLRHRVPLRPRRMIVAAHGTDRVEAVSVARVGRDGRPVEGSAERHTVDAVGVGWGFTPQLDIAVTLGLRLTRDRGGTPVVEVDRLHRSSRPRVYAAGETCGVGGAALALVEGRLAARGVAHDLTGADPASHPAPGPDGVAAVRLGAFADAIISAHPVPVGWVDALTDETIVCRCEEVRFGAVRAAIEAGATDARQVKQLTRTGMGWCQGRVCGYAAALLSAGAPGEPDERLIGAPMPLGALAQTDDQHDAM